MASFNKRNPERSHEENQERAYIAASHRGDRSMDARMESARKASEIHKKRTGKALRITHEDVRNEEMYQEMDPEEEAKLNQSQSHREANKEHPRNKGRGAHFSDQMNK